MGEGTEQGEARWYVGTGHVEIRTETVATPAAGEVRLSALYGGISRGTERLVLNGRIPASEHSRMRAPNMAGAFPFPVKYGYATVGRVESGPADLIGRIGFALYPHQTAFNLPVESLALLPKDVPASRGVLAANMETALNAVWDAAPGPAGSPLPSCRPSLTAAVFSFASNTGASSCTICSGSTRATASSASIRPSSTMSVATRTAANPVRLPLRVCRR